MQILLLYQAIVLNRLVSRGSHLLKILFTLVHCNHSAFLVRESGKNTKNYTTKWCFKTDGCWRWYGV